MRVQLQSILFLFIRLTDFAAMKSRAHQLKQMTSCMSILHIYKKKYTNKTEKKKKTERTTFNLTVSRCRLMALYLKLNLAEPLKTNGLNALVCVNAKM